MTRARLQTPALDALMGHLIEVTPSYLFKIAALAYSVRGMLFRLEELIERANKTSSGSDSNEHWEVGGHAFGPNQDDLQLYLLQFRDE